MYFTIIVSDALVKEYLSSCNMAEASRSLTDLEVPHFHQHIVCKADYMVIKRMHKKTEEVMCKPLSSIFHRYCCTL